MKFTGRNIPIRYMLLLAPGLFAGCLRPADAPPGEPENASPSVIEDKEAYAPSRNPTAWEIPGGKMTLDAVGAFTREFAVDVPADGEYYLGAWIDGTPGRDQAVLVDGKFVPGTAFSFTEGGWQSARALNGKEAARIRLEQGRHTLAVRSMGSAPNIDKLVLGRSPEEISISGQAYADYLETLVRDSRPMEKSGAEKALAKAAQDPLIGYYYSMDVPVNYTWYAWVSLTQGVTYEFATGHLTAGADPVLHVFNPANTSQSWVNDDFAPPDRNAKLTFTAPSTASYMVLMRAYGSSTGTATVYQSGAVLGSLSPMAGVRMYTGSSTPGGNLNYFTGMKSASGVDTRIWLFDANDLVKAQNDDYTGPGTFSWGYHSRLNGSFGNIYYIMVSGYSSTSPSGTTDLYAKLPDATDAPTAFPNLNANDAIQTAPYSEVYNCISWSGGITSTWHWPPEGGNPWYVAGNPLQTFHNFYSNTCAAGGTCKRYPEANVWKYGSYSTDPANRIVALWYNNAAASYTHGSVKKPANGFPHGYDWESKPGRLERTFHPRDALVDETFWGYGHIVGYYQHTGYTAKVAAGDKPPEDVTEKESIDRGSSVLEEPVVFSPQEKARLSGAAARLSAEDRGEFEKLFAAWTATFPKHRHQSNPAAYRQGPEFDALARFSEGLGKGAWPQLFEKLESRDPIVGFAVVSLVKGYDAVLEEAVDEWKKLPARADGKFVIFSPENARIRFAKKLIASEM